LRPLTASVLIVVAAVALGGCRDDEQGRSLSFDPGKYSGPQMPKSPQQAAQGWREHAEKMKF
jgi:hypothetical protein